MLVQTLCVEYLEYARRANNIVYTKKKLKGQCEHGPKRHTVLMSLRPTSSIEDSVRVPEGTIAISYTLDIQEIIESVQDETAGATTVFIGET